MDLKIIACISSNSGLGKNNGELLFHIKEDLQRFKEITSENGSIVIMGRKTFDSIVKLTGGALKDRINVVLTRDENYESKYGELAYNSVDRIINHHKTMVDSDKKIFVIGGEEIYNIMLPFASEAILTIVNKHVEEADAFYPIDLQDSLGFVPIEQSEDFYSDKYECYYKFVRYVRDESKQQLS